MIQPPTAEQLDAFVAEQMQAQAIPGLSLAVVQSGSLIAARGYGLANIELNVPATSHTVYQLQSITKSFVALGVMMLVGEARLNLDIPIKTYFPDLPSSWATVTTRHLLTMTSGIQNFIGDHDTVADVIAFAQHTTSDAQLIEWAANRPLHFTPGTSYHYSPTNYHLLGLLIGIITNQPWHVFLAERMFEPLQMTQTRVVDWSAIVPHRAAGYVQLEGPLQNGYYMSPTIMASASGGLYSTVLDLVKWDAALYTEQLVSQVVLEEMWTPHRVTSFFEEASEDQYGLGWDIERYGGERMVGHRGDHITGFTNKIVRFIDQKLTIIVLTNLLPVDIDQIVKGVASLYLSSLQTLES